MMRRRDRTMVRVTSLVLGLYAACPPAAARSSQWRSAPPSPIAAPVPGDPAVPVRPMLPAAGGWTDEALIPVALALSFALIEFDDDIRGWARGEFATDRLRPVARAFKPLGDRSTVFLGLGAWAVGSASGAEDIADAGLHTSAALLTTGTAVSLLKVGAGRWRPSVGAGAEDFGLGRGAFPLDNRAQSFPSGHTATAFAIAASLSEEAKRHWPEQERWLTPALYAAAGLVGLSRVLDDAHWTSDVLFGAALGTVAGRTSIRRLHRP